MPVIGHRGARTVDRGVDLHGPNDANAGPVYSLPRQSATPTLVRLAPGGSAHVLITYLVGTGTPGPDVNNWRPTTVVTTPPEETTQLTATSGMDRVLAET